MYDKDNIFAKILRGEIPSNKIYETEYSLAFKDIQPAAPQHVLVIPKMEVISFHDFVASATPEFIANFFRDVRYVAGKLGAEKSGYRLITNHGENAGQTVKHFHIHILSGRKMANLLPQQVEE